MPTDASVYVPVETLTGFMIDALVKMGVPPDDARIVAAAARDPLDRRPVTKVEGKEYWYDKDGNPHSRQRQGPHDGLRQARV